MSFYQPLDWAMSKSLAIQKSTVQWNDRGKNQTGIGKSGRRGTGESVINYFKEFAAKEIRQAVGGTGVNRKKFKTTEIKTCLYVDENYIIKKMMMVGESWGEMESAWKQK